MRLERLRSTSKTNSPTEINLLLNPTDIGYAAESQFSRRVHIIEGIRNFFLLLPLMITWLSFSMASSVFAQSKTTGKSFFDIWTNGFPDSSSLLISIGPLHSSLSLVIFGGWHWFSFADIALTDFILLACVLFFNQLAHAVESNASNEANKLSTWLREEADQLCKASLVKPIGTGPGSDQPEWAVQVNTAIGELQKVLETVKTVTGKSQEDFSETIDKFSDTYKQQSQSVENLIQNTRDIEVAITHLNAVFSDDTYIRLEDVLSKMEKQFDKMAEQQERTAQAFTSIATGINKLAQPFAAVGLAEMVKQREQAERANTEMLMQLRDDLKHYAPDRSQNPLHPAFWQKVFRARKGPY